MPTSITNEDAKGGGEGGKGKGKDVKEMLGKRGGWQFLIDVTREEAESMLGELEIGSFLIR